MCLLRQKSSETICSAWMAKSSKTDKKAIKKFNILLGDLSRMQFCTGIFTFSNLQEAVALKTFKFMKFSGIFSLNDGDSQDSV